MIRTLRHLFPIVALGVAVVPFESLHAQRLQSERATAGPTISTAAVGVRASKPAPAPLPASPRHADSKRNVSMMIVGGAALIVGAIISGTPGTIIMVGGAGVGLYGLYKYLE